MEDALSKPSGNRQGTETILLVEDETMRRMLTAEALRDSGYAVLEAQDSMDGVRIAKDHSGRQVKASSKRKSYASRGESQGAK